MCLPFPPTGPGTEARFDIIDHAVSTPRKHGPGPENVPRQTALSRNGPFRAKGHSARLRKQYFCRLPKSPDANCSEPRNANVRKDTDSHIFVKENLFGFPGKNALKPIN